MFFHLMIAIFLGLACPQHKHSNNNGGTVTTADAPGDPGDPGDDGTGGGTGGGGTGGDSGQTPPPKP